MRNRSLVRFLLCLLALGASGMEAQSKPDSYLSLGVGRNLRRATVDGGGKDTGWEIRFGAARRITEHYRWTGGLGFALFESREAIAVCLPGPCNFEERNLSLMSDLSFGVTGTPIVGAPWLELSFEPGLHWAGTDNWASRGGSSRSHATLGFTGGVTIPFARGNAAVGVRGTSYPFGLAEIRSLVTPAVALRF
jgi:hypothetical protein